MGDISELNVLVVVATFLSVTVLLIGWIPAQFYTSDATYLVVNVPDVFDSIDIVNYAQTENFTVGDGFSESWGKDTFGHDMQLVVSETYGIYNTHFYGWLLFSYHQMEWVNDHGVNRGSFLEFDLIIEDHDANNLSAYRVECEHFYMQAWIGYNTSDYGSFYEAIDNDEGRILFAIDFDQTASTWSAWSIISGILRFDLPDVNPYLNALIAIPIWISIAYVSFILVLRALGALFGGGA